MADKAISELVSAEQIKAADMFVLEQDGAAKKLTGQVLLNWLTAAADGHGGVQNIVKTGSSGLVDTYTITLADQTKQTFTVTNGEKGDRGDNSYVWIKYASVKPTSGSVNLSDIPDRWMGTYSGEKSSPPASYTEYKWFEIKGEQGDTGKSATVLEYSSKYQVSDNGTVIPSGAWYSDVPSTPQGKYLWVWTTIIFNSGSPISFYSVSRMGIDGTGAVATVNGKEPDGTGNVVLSASDVGALANTYTPPVQSVNGKTGAVSLNADDVNAVPRAGGTMTGPLTLQNTLTANGNIILKSGVNYFTGESQLPSSAPTGTLVFVTTEG